jgi:hypothetical protein
MLVDAILVHFNRLLALFIFLNHVDRLLHIPQNDIAMAVIGLEDSLSLSKPRKKSTLYCLDIHAACPSVRGLPAASRKQSRPGTSEPGRGAPRPKSLLLPLHLPY